MRDRYGRQIDYMRISVTDRCNLRCRYCMPDSDEKLQEQRILDGIEDEPTQCPSNDMEIPLRRDLNSDERMLTRQLMTDAQILLIAREAAGVGIRKIKITGGEPLMRPGCPSLIRALKQIPGIEQVTLTTNGVLLSRYWRALLDAGLDAVNISLDTLDRAGYEAITGGDALASVLRGIELALSSESAVRVKINAVPQAGVNEEELLSLAELTRDRALDVRFIEMMPIGAGAACSCISNEEILFLIKKRYPGVEADLRTHGNGPAVYCRIPGFVGSIGFISAIHGKFCASCNRLRLTSAGLLKPCLCFSDAVSVTEHLKLQSPEMRRRLIREDLLLAIRQKPEGHRFENRSEVTETKCMASIGG